MLEVKAWAIATIIFQAQFFLVICFYVIETGNPVESPLALVPELTR